MCSFVAKTQNPALQEMHFDFTISSLNDFVGGDREEMSSKSHNLDGIILSCPQQLHLCRGRSMEQRSKNKEYYLFLVVCSY